MRASISALLAVLLITTPITQVLGQTTQGNAVGGPDRPTLVFPLSMSVLDTLIVKSSGKVDTMGTTAPVSLVRLPPLLETHRGADLFPVAPAFNELTLTTPRELSTGAKVAVVVVVLVVVVGLLVLIECLNAREGADSSCG